MGLIAEDNLSLAGTRKMLQSHTGADRPVRLIWRRTIRVWGGNRLGVVLGD